MDEQLESFLGPELKLLLRDGEKLIASSSGGFSDYSFVVFPYAKVYEGFLKKLFFQIGAINEWQFNNERWRVGRALNPQLEKELRHEESVYDRIVEHCGGVELADKMWNAWKIGRNQVFHYFPKAYKTMSLEEAKGAINLIKEAMRASLEGCKI